MGITFWAPDCNHNNMREKCQFFRFPKNLKEFRRWLRLLRREAEPGPGARICSCHFRDGDKKNGPEIFQHNITKKFPSHYLSPEAKVKRKLFMEDPREETTRPLPAEEVIIKEEFNDIFEESTSQHQNNVILRNDVSEEQHQSLSMFFQNVAATVGQFTPELQIKAKAEIMSIVTEIELENISLRSGNTPSTSRDQFINNQFVPVSSRPSSSADSYTYRNSNSPIDSKFYPEEKPNIDELALILKKEHS